VPDAAPPQAPPDGVRASRFSWLASTLSGRLLAWTVGFVFLAEAVLYFPSAASYRRAWLTERLQAAELAALALEASPTRQVNEELSRRLLERAQVVAVARQAEDIRELLLGPSMPVDGPLVMADLEQAGMLRGIPAALDHLIAPPGRFLRIVGKAPMGADDDAELEVIVPEAPLQAAMQAFSLRILLLSLFISLVTAGLVYVALLASVVRPVRRITQAIEQFRTDPRRWTSEIAPSPRRDEIGRAERALADMQTAVRGALASRERLANLGEAVARINHDLRNMLTAANLVSEGISASTDPTVRRYAPRLERALGRAVALTEASLAYGRADGAAEPVRVQPTALAPLLAEALELALAVAPGTEAAVAATDAPAVLADPDALLRVVVNLARNAAQAMAAAGSAPARLTLSAAAAGADRVALHIADTGPGLPRGVRERLFQPFVGGGGAGSTGLGLAIARELTEAMGGTLQLGSTGPAGTVFVLSLRAA